jgi:hypothetical protein
MLVVSIYFRYENWLELRISLGKFTIYDNLVNTRLWINIVFEQILCLIAPYGFLKGITITEEITLFGVSIVYEVNDILLSLCFLRIYLVIRYLFYLTPYYNLRT